MDWQLLLIWVLVITTLVWFVRDEQRLKAQAAPARAPLQYPRAPRPRGPLFGPGSVKVPLPAPRTGGLSVQQRRFIQKLKR